MISNRTKHNIDCAKCYYANLCIGNASALESNAINSLNKLITKVQVLKKGEHIFRKNDDLHYIYALHSGYCKDYTIDDNGKEYINNFYFPGDLLGLESIYKNKHLFSAVSLSEAKLCMIPLQPLLELMENSPTLFKRFINIASYKIQNDKRIRMTTNTKTRVVDFILNTLHRLQARRFRQDHIQLPISQIDISNFLGMAHETVSRVLHELNQKNIISILNREIYIKDINKLRTAAVN